MAFAADDGDGSTTRDLWVSAADGSGVRRVLDCKDPCNQADAPAWSPDGRHLAYATLDANEDGVYNGRIDILDLATGRTRTVATAPDDLHDFMWPRWSPDGRQLVAELQTWSERSFAADLTDTTLVTVDASGRGGFRPIPGIPAWSTYPDWHPSKDLILFFSQPVEAGGGEPTNLYVVRPDGSGLHAITSFALGDNRPVQPSWTPDGRRIMFALAKPDFGDWRMMTVRADGTGMASATAGEPLFGTHPRLQPVPRR